jgi:hypothetical protein
MSKGNFLNFLLERKFFMIVYDLKCEGDHIFEAWFKDGKAFEDQRARKLINCPVCGNCHIRMVPSRKMSLGKSKQTLQKRDPKELSIREAYNLFEEYISHNFEDVGDRFSDVAIKIHHGFETQRNIKGTTTPAEEECLREEGIKFLKIPSLKLDS